jgi:hypothetical protein
MLYNKDWDKTSPISLLRRAADLIEERGSAKYVLEVDEGNAHFPLDPRRAPQRIGSMCIQGAIMMASAGKVSWSQLDKTAIEAIGLVKNNLGMSVPAWNNRDDVSQDMIVAKLREVADQHEMVGA